MHSQATVTDLISRVGSDGVLLWIQADGCWSVVVGI